MRSFFVHRTRIIATGKDVKVIIEGFLRCRHEALPQRSEFSRLATSQNPHNLFIACSNRRVVSGFVTQRAPGDPLVIRNRVASAY